MTSGQRIKAARVKAGLTQKELGTKLGVSESFIAQYETDKRNPKKETIVKIADALGVHFLELYSDEEILEITAYVRVGMKIAEKNQEKPVYDFSVEYIRYLQQHGYEFSETERQAVSLFNQLKGGIQQLAITDLARLCLNPKYRKDGDSIFKNSSSAETAPQSSAEPQEGAELAPQPSAEVEEGKDTAPAPEGLKGPPGGK